MKKTIIALTIATAAGSSFGGQAALSIINDTQVDRAGTRITLSADKPVFGSIVPVVSGTFTNQYARFAAGGEVGLFNVGPLKVAGTVTGVRQQSKTGSNGNGFAAGVTASYALTKNVNLVVGVEAFNGASKIDKYDSTVTTVGLSTRF